MNIEEYYKNFDIEEFKRKYGTRFSTLGVSFVNEWNKDEEYFIEDEVICYKKYVKKLYKSLIDNNINKDPLISKQEWENINIDNLAIQKYITDNDIQEIVNICFIIFSGYCYETYSIITPLLIDFFECLIGLNIIDKATNQTGILTTSESIDSMSISGDANDIIKQYPIFNNPFGLRFLYLYNLLFGMNVKLYNCYKNDTYDY